MYKRQAEILREKVVRDVAADPGWYAAIITKRLHRVLFENTPPRLAAGANWVDVPGLSPLLAPFAAFVLLCYLVRREWSIPRLLMFPFAVGGVAIAVSTAQDGFVIGKLGVVVGHVGCSGIWIVGAGRYRTVCGQKIIR